MPYAGIRDYIQKLEEYNEIVYIKDEVDWNLEIGAVTRRTYDLQGPAVLFENIKGYSRDYRILCGIISTFRRFAIAMDMPPESSVKQMIREYYERIKTPLPPQTVSTGMCKQNKITDPSKIDLSMFPAPKWNQRDGGRYLGTFSAIVTKDPETGWINVGNYRMMIHDARSTGMLISPTQHIGYHFMKYKALNKPMPCAVAIGVDPIVELAACGRFQANISEYDMAGALRKAPVKLVKCETLDLEVPADAEIVLEGYIDPNKSKKEGPLGEYIGYYSDAVINRPVFDVHCVTYRSQPIYTGSAEGKPIVEDHLLMSISNSAISRKNLIDDLGIPAIEDIAYHPWSPANHLVVVSTNGNPYPGHDKHIASALWASKVGSRADWVIIVNKDIDITNMDEVVWAMCTRCKPDRDITIIPNFHGSELNPQGRNPAVVAERRDLCKVLIDCRFPSWFKPEEVPAVLDWNEFPEEIRNRVTSRFDSLLKSDKARKI